MLALSDLAGRDKLRSSRVRIPKKSPVLDIQGEFDLTGENLVGTRRLKQRYIPLTLTHFATHDLQRVSHEEPDKTSREQVKRGVISWSPKSRRS